MKKIVMLVALLGFGLMVAGCDSGSSTPAKNTGSSAAPTTAAPKDTK